MRRIPVRLRFSLKVLVILLSIIAVVFGWRAQAGRTQKRAVTAIQSVGGTVFFDYHENGPRSWSTSGSPRGPQWLRTAIGPEYFDRVVYVGLFETPSDSQWIKAVNDLGTVKTLLLSGSNVTDATLEKLDGSSALLELHLTNAAVTDNGVRLLGKFPNLRWLTANSTSISDDGLADLAELSELRELNVKNTLVSDDGVASIAGLTNLQKLDIRGTRISQKGVERLRAAIPGVRVLQ